MLDLKKLFVRDARETKRETPDPDLDPDSEFEPTEGGPAGLEVEYHTVIAAQFRRAGVDPDCITIDVRNIGSAPDGREVMMGMIRLARWDRDSALRVLLGLPLLEAKVRKVVRASWLADFSHFGGLWLHSSEQVQSSRGPAELRELLLQLVPPSSMTADSGPQPLATDMAPLDAGPDANAVAKDDDQETVIS